MAKIKKTVVVQRCIRLETTWRHRPFLSTQPVIDNPVI